ncbi:MAG TPA: hypothetical protein P5539_12335 [Mesotoga sp.]|nr:hypothetical protein [Mesotoga sp.]
MEKILWVIMSIEQCEELEDSVEAKASDVINDVFIDQNFEIFVPSEEFRAKLPGLCLEKLGYEPVTDSWNSDDENINLLELYTDQYVITLDDSGMPIDIVIVELFDKGVPVAETVPTEQEAPAQ